MRMRVTKDTNRSWTARWGLSVLAMTGILLPWAGTAAAPLSGEQGPASRVEERAVRLISAGQGGHIGVAINEIESSQVAGSLDAGAFIESVSPDGPAEEAGLQPGDVVVEFDGERVRGVRQLRRLVQESPINREVPIVVMRDGNRVELGVTPEEGPGVLAGFEEWVPEMSRLGQQIRESVRRGDQGYRFDFRGDVRSGRRLGIEVAPVGQQLADYFNVETGVLVTSVAPGSVASAAGLTAGDVITAVDGEPVDDVGTLQRLVAEIDPPATIRLDVTRDGDAITLEATFEEDRPRRRSRTI